MKRVKPQHLSLHDEMIICDHCGEKTDIYVAIGNFKYCSTLCKEQADNEAFDSKLADKFDEQRDFEMERDTPFDSERDTSIEDKDYLNESKEFEC